MRIFLRLTKVLALLNKGEKEAVIVLEDDSTMADFIDLLDRTLPGFKETVLNPNTGIADSINIYVNGENKGYLTSLAGVSFDSDNGLVIGRIATGTDDFYLHGHMDEVRVNKGTARWDAAFTPPLHPDPAP